MTFSAILRREWAADLSVDSLYALLRLRVDVFVVEQKCPYPELDGRDLEPSTRHFWLESEGRVVATLRLLEEPDGVFRIGRVCVADDVRGHGLSGRLMAAALAETGSAPSVLDAQTYVTGFYASYGFVADGDEYLEDGIPHVIMRRPAPQS